MTLIHQRGMTLMLSPHSTTLTSPVSRVWAYFQRLYGPREQASLLKVYFEASGDIYDVAVPSGRPAEDTSRADDLWMHTCFEIFIRPADSAAYFEFNLSPSGDWAVYHFDRYREGMRRVEGARCNSQFSNANISDLNAGASFYIDHTEGLSFDVPWLVGVSAVIEDRDHRKSYWALAHAPGKPDFHHPDAFALTVEPA